VSILDADIRDPEGWQVFLYGLAAFSLGAWLGVGWVAQRAVARLPRTIDGTVQIPEYLHTAATIGNVAFGTALACLVGLIAIDHWVLGDE